MDNYEKVKNSMNDAIINIYTGHVATTKPTSGKLGNEDKANTDWDSVVNDCKELITSTWNTYISWYVTINYGEKAPCPEFEFIEEQKGKKEQADIWTGYMDKGGLRPTEKFYINHADLQSDEFTVDFSSPVKTDNNNDNLITKALSNDIKAMAEDGLIGDWVTLTKAVQSRTKLTDMNVINSIAANIVNELKLEV